jgi:hypothetical protein
MDAQDQLDGFIAKFSPDVAATARAVLARLEARIPGATRLAYDNFNALAIGFAANDRAGSVVVSIALYPKWINLFFLRGVELDDPHGMLKGAGSRVRHVPRIAASTLDDSRIEALIAAALAQAEPGIDPTAPSRLIIKAVAARQRPRRAAGD